MQHESVKVIGGLVRDALIGVAAGVVCELMEASPAFSAALTKRMLRSSFERMSQQFAKMGVDTSRLSSVELCTDPECGECRREMH